MKLLGSTENKITKDKFTSSRNERSSISPLYIVNNDYQQDSRVLYTFVSDKPFVSLLEI